MIGRQLDVLLISAGRRAARAFQGWPSTPAPRWHADGKLTIHTANTKVDADHAASGT